MCIVFYIKLLIVTRENLCLVARTVYACECKCIKFIFETPTFCLSYTPLLIVNCTLLYL